MNLLLVLAIATAAPLDTATFAGGCFWSMERAFDQVDGVVSVTVGYTGGHTAHPSYEQVSTGQTGHRESVQVVYDPRQITYERLVDAFWHDIDPTQADGQFCDHGDEYRTAIFYRDTAQHRVAAASRRALERRFAQPVVTEIVRATAFYPAEEYHQHYYRKNPIRYGMYRVACGRDRRLAEVWGAAAPHAEGHATMRDTKPSDAELRQSLTPVQYQVTQHEAAAQRGSNRRGWTRSALERARRPPWPAPEPLSDGAEVVRRVRDGADRHAQRVLVPPGVRLHGNEQRLVLLAQSRSYGGPFGVVDRGHRPAPAAIARGRLAAQALGREGDARGQVVDVPGDRRVARSPLLGGVGRAQTVDGAEDSRPRGCIGEVGPGTGRPFERLAQHSRQQPHRHRGRRTC